MVYDIAVSGLGPAGSVFLKSLTEKKLKVIAFDKEKFPRRKPCAGGLTPKAYELLSSLYPNLNEAVELTVNRFRLTYGEREVILPSPKPLVYLTLREKLDYLLFKGIPSWVEVREGEEVLSAEREGDCWKVKTDKGEYKARVLISADGVNSRLARLFKIRREIGFTYEADVRKTFREEIVVDFTHFKWGYYWAFPKRGLTTTGLGEFKSRQLFRSLKELLNRFNEKHGIEGPVEWEGGFPIPAGLPQCDCYRDGLLFLGDSAGLVDPLTGEGIYYAARSGQIGAQATERALAEGNLKLLREYEKRVKNEFSPEFRWARVVGTVFFKARSLNFTVIERSKELSELTAQLLSGEIPYRSAFFKFLRLIPTTLVRRG
jgi:geranylgeranyl reductase family protein